MSGAQLTTLITPRPAGDDDFPLVPVTVFACPDAARPVGVALKSNTRCAGNSQPTGNGCGEKLDAFVMLTEAEAVQLRADLKEIVLDLRAARECAASVHDDGSQEAADDPHDGGPPSTPAAVSGSPRIPCAAGEPVAGVDLFRTRRG